MWRCESPHHLDRHRAVLHYKDAETLHRVYPRPQTGIAGMVPPIGLLIESHTQAMPSKLGYHMADV